MSSEEEAHAPDFSEQARAMQELLPYLHDIVGDTAEITTEDYWGSEPDGSVDHDQAPSIRSAYIRPHNAAALPMDVSCEQWIVIELGRIGGRWELGYDSGDLALAKALLGAAAAGNVIETTALGRSKVDVTLTDGTIVTETGYDGCLTILIPLPGWKTWGRTTRYEPYRANASE
ncbi:hypothetical protein [Frigoribacterium sp. MCBA15_019]|uniref:hypothetical protein n=1 Tax=Frigoribacterium sp. MCBA15_019 TaxID=1898745 RepID=UPI0008DE2B33|nr:hypothetical protein [Frigoribacterium sp. MCBA15_019]OII22949.1 hypothetical protein BIV04_16275 [Frigoribacterium sp. MCBA15_019]